MTDASDGAGRLDRRGFIRLATAGTGLAGGLGAALAQPAQTLADITRQLSPSVAHKLNTADIIVETLIVWGATEAFGENSTCTVRSCG